MFPESNSNNPENGWYPTKDFYESNPRSAEIRKVVIQILEKMNTIVHDPSSVENHSKTSQLYSDIERLSGKLIELGITPQLHMGRTITDYESDPVMAAEWIAAQILEMTGWNLIPKEKATSSRDMIDTGLISFYKDLLDMQ